MLRWRLFTRLLNRNSTSLRFVSSVGEYPPKLKDVSLCKAPVGHNPLEKSLDVAIVGLPNAGKSTVLNRLVGQKVSAISPKRNTTRENVLGYMTQEWTQICFWDTPGFVSYLDSKSFIRSLYISSVEKIKEVDLTIIVIDGAKKINDRVYENISSLFEQALCHSDELVIVLTKVDLVTPKTNLLLKTNEIIDIFEKTKEKTESNSIYVNSVGKKLDNQIDNTTADVCNFNKNISTQKIVDRIDNVNPTVENSIDHNVESDVPNHSVRKFSANSEEIVSDETSAKAKRSVKYIDIDGDSSHPPNVAPHEKPWRSGMITKDDKNRFNFKAKRSNYRGENVDVFMVIAKESLNVDDNSVNDGMDDLKKFLLNRAKSRPWSQNPDERTDLTAEERITEIFREKLFIYLNKEIPYNVDQITQYIGIEKETGVIVCEQMFIVKNKSIQKLLTSLLGRIARDAKEDLWKIYKRHVRLKLRVKVDKVRKDESSDAPTWL